MADTHQQSDLVFDVVVIGAGAMGLSAAYRAAKAGASTLTLESGSVPGGMAAHFDFEGVSLERFYHFMCLTDHDTLELLDELGLADSVVWKHTRMGYFTRNKLYPWGNPVALLMYPHLNLVEKFRYGLMAFWCTKRKAWGASENMTAAASPEVLSIHRCCQRDVACDPHPAHWPLSLVPDEGKARAYRGRNADAG